MTVARKLQNASDLSAEEQQRVRVAIRHLHARVSDWMLVAKTLRFAKSTVGGHDPRAHAREREHGVPSGAFPRASIDDLLAGRFTPPSMCPCSKRPISEDAAR